MKFKTLIEGKFFRPALGALLAALGGLVLLTTPFGEPLEHASYDYLFRFDARTVTNQVVLILMDNEAYDELHQVRGQPWDRGLHAQLLEKLADDHCALVAFDSFFKIPRDQIKDEALARAMRRQRHIVLMAEQAEVVHPALMGARPILPAEPFLSSAHTNWGVAWLDPDLDSIVRRHWPFPAPGAYPSLPRTAAQVVGANLNQAPHEQWLRYYRKGAWVQMSYRFALTQAPNYFRDKFVFIGTQPRTSMVDGEKDEFHTPHSRWTGVSTGGVEILITSFLNLLNRDWLERPSIRWEAIALMISGILLGAAFGLLPPLPAFLFSVIIALGVAAAGIGLSYLTNYWFPWLIIAGAQVPFALTWALIMPTFRRVQATVTQTSAHGRHQPAEVESTLPEIPDYELFPPPFAEGAYGKVCLARNAAGQWRALKFVFRNKFEDADPYEREFNGIKRYQPISDKHPGLLRVEFVSQQEALGYFYYVMELGDALSAGWENNSSTYRPRDLASEYKGAPGKKLQVPECVRIGLALAGALDFLHRQGLTHRDIKPQNVIFVNGQPKLADAGLVAEIRPDEERTYVGTPGYMPPGEMPGTPQADIYALGMLLYVLSTGRTPTHFPELATTLINPSRELNFLPLNDLLLKACDPNPARRFATAGEVLGALQELAVRFKINSRPSL